MNPAATIIVSSCAILLFVWIVWRDQASQNWSSVTLNVSGLILYVLLLRVLFHFPSFTSEYPKASGERDFVGIALAMYVCMLVGMVAEYLYHYLDERAPRHEKFQVGTFIKPFLVSPLVFIPLAASLQNANLDLSRLDAPRLMLFLVAFENGFLWRSYFTRKINQSRSKKNGEHSR